MVTLDDVAKLALVSPMTVSRYINNSGYVSKKTAEKIKLAVNALDYHPNGIAKSLVTKKTNTFGLVIASIINPFYPELVLGAEDEAYNNNNTHVILCNVEGKASIRSFCHTLMEKGVDGIAFCHLNLGEDDAKWLHDRDIRCSLVDNQTNCSYGTVISTDDCQGGYDATTHLISQGHKQIATIHGWLNQKMVAKNTADDAPIQFEGTFQFLIWQKRTQGFLMAMTEHNLPVPKDYMQLGSGSPGTGVEGGRQAMYRLLALPSPPTAVFCENDLMAIGAYKAVLESGLKLADDIAIIGYDGIAMCQALHPTLSTMCQPKYEIGKAAIRQLLNPSQNPFIKLHPQLIIGGSSVKSN